MAGAKLITQGIERRRAIMRFIKGYLKKNGFSPSIEEIAIAVDLSSKTAVRHHLEILVADGQLAMTPGKYRSIRIAEQRKPPKKS